MGRTPAVIVFLSVCAALTALRVVRRDPGRSAGLLRMGGLASASATVGCLMTAAGYGLSAALGQHVTPDAALAVVSAVLAGVAISIWHEFRAIAKALAP
jgi:hypothetical protein